MSAGLTRVPVQLGARSYDVVVGEGALAEAGSLIAPFLSRKRVFVAADENAESLHGHILRDALSAAGIEGVWVRVPSGEQQKSFAGIEAMLDAFLAKGIERKDFIVAFGGGVVGDLAGFAAAIVNVLSGILFHVLSHRYCRDEELKRLAASAASI